MYEQIRYEVADAAAVITLDRPEALNAWTATMGHELRDAVARAEADPEVVAIVLTGAGRGFCAGADMDGLASLSGARATTDPAPRAVPDEPGTGDDGIGRFGYLIDTAKPVIAAINGPVAGMAVPLVLSCDLRFMADDAVVVTAFAHRGLVAEFAVSWLLDRLVGPAHALDLLLSSRRVDGREAERIGLVNRCLPGDALMDHCRSYVRDLATHSSPASMAIMKRQVHDDLHRSFAEAHAASDRLMAESFHRPDFREGVAAYVESRPPSFPRLPAGDHDA